MNAFLAMLKTAEGAQKPTDADEEILDSLKSLSDDTEEVTAFLNSLVEIDQARAGAYLVQCRDHLPELFEEVKVALEEEPYEEDETQDEMVEDEEMPPEGEGEELPPMEEEPMPEEGMGEFPMEGQDDLPMEEEEEPMPEGMDPAMDENEPSMEEAPIGEDEVLEEDEEVAVEPVVDQEELETEEATADDLDMVLFQTNAKAGPAKAGPHWSVFYKGRPLCSIRLADQENSEEIADLFVTDDYPQHIKDACGSPIGIKETLNSVNAQWYMGVIDTGQVAREAREAAGQELEDEFASRLASLKEDLLNTVNLAIVASNKGSKGLFVENKLKAACVQVLRDAGVVGASSALNEVWAEAAQTYMQDVLKVAEKWLGYSPEAMQEVTAEIVGTEVEIEDELEVEQTPEAVQASVRRQVAGSNIQNVPIRTMKQVPHGSENDYRQATTHRVSSALSRRMGQRRMGR